MNIQTFSILTDYTHSKYQPPGSQVMLDAGTFQSHAALSSTLFQFQLSSVQLLSHVWLFAAPWMQHARLPCPSPTPGACSNSCPSSWWCHPTISSSAIPFSSCLQSFPASGSFSMSQFFTSVGQSIGALASVFPMNIQGWFPLWLTDLISFMIDRFDFLAVQGTLKSLL